MRLATERLTSHACVMRRCKRCKRNPGERSAKRQRKVSSPTVAGSLFYLAPCYIRRNVFPLCIVASYHLSVVLSLILFKIHCFHTSCSLSPFDLPERGVRIPRHRVIPRQREMPLVAKNDRKISTELVGRGRRI